MRHLAELRNTYFLRHFSRLDPVISGFSLLCAITKHVVAICILDRSNSEMALLTKEQAAEELGVTVANLDAWRWRGIGPAFIKLPKGTRYDVAELRRWIQDRTCQPSVNEALAAR